MKNDLMNAIAPYLPGFLGALLKTLKDKNKGFWEHVVGVIGGSLVSFYFAEPLVAFLQLEDTYLSAISFGVGYVGLNLIEMSIQWLFKQRP